VWAASSASRSQRAEHVPVPLARHHRPPACHGRRRDVRRARHLCAPHPARRKRSEPSTSPCRSRVASLRPPDTAGGGMCAGRATCVGRIQRVAIAASRARPRATRASRPPIRQPRLRRDVRLAMRNWRCSSSGSATRPQRPAGATQPPLAIHEEGGSAPAAFFASRRAPPGPGRARAGPGPGPDHRPAPPAARPACLLSALHASACAVDAIYAQCATRGVIASCPPTPQGCCSRTRARALARPLCAVTQPDSR
jgi:hypothetical protein